MHTGHNDDVVVVVDNDDGDGDEKKDFNVLDDDGVWRFRLFIVAKKQSKWKN